MPSEPIAHIRNLTVRYGSFTALKDFSIELPQGSVGLLGPNGAGKTTLLKTLLGFVKPAQGEASILGLDIARHNERIRQTVGLMPEQDCHIPGMSAVQFVAFAGELAGMPGSQAMRRAHEVLEYCGLGEARYRKVETYSTGMKQRIKLAQALIHGPKLLLLDEPTNGLDPAGREQMLDLVRDISHDKSINVLVSSHLLPDIERVCDEVIVLTQGQLRASGKIADLKRLEGHPYDIELREPSPAYVMALVRHGAQIERDRGYSVRAKFPGTSEQTVHTIWQAAREVNAQVRGFAPAERTLEEAFLEAITAPASAPAFTL